MAPEAAGTRPRSQPGSKHRGLLLSALVLVLPFLYLQWMVPPPLGGELRIGMDYPRISGPQQMELLFCLVNGSFPLYVPGFAGGQGAGALTAGQLYHPLTYLAAAMPGYWDGHAQDWNTLLRLVSLGVAHLLLFRLLRRLLAGDWLALSLSAVTVFNLRMLNIFHGGSALEAYTGHLFAAVAVFWCWLHPERWLPRVGLIASIYGIVTSGHPQFAYYALLGTAMVILLAPSMLEGVEGRERARLPDLVRFWVRMGACCAAGALLAAAYMLPFQLEFLQDSMRVGRAYEFSLWWGDTLAGTLNNFFQPLQAAASVSFGGSALTLTAALAPLLALCGVRLPRSVWIAWGLALVVFLHAQGDRTPVHFLLWKFFPMFGSVRGPGRLTLVLPILFLVILCGVARADVRGGLAARMPPLALLGALGLVAALVQWVLPGELTDGSMPNTPAIFQHLAPGVHRALFLWGLAALAALTTLGLSARRGLGSLAWPAGLVLFLAVSMQTHVSLRHGTWIEKRIDSPTLAEMRAQKESRLEFVGNPGNGLYSAVVLEQIARSCLETQLARLYFRHETAADNDEAYAILDRGRDPDVAVVVGQAPEEVTGDVSDARVELTYSSFNRIAFDVLSPAPALLGLGVPWSRRWEATLDGEPATILRSNGAYQAVQVPGGESRVELRFTSPATTAGVSISCLTLLLLGGWISFRALRGTPRVAVLALLVLIVAGGWTRWRSSLYDGRNLGTNYVWTPDPGPKRLNLAFARPTSMSPSLPVQWNEQQELGRVPVGWGSGRGVDGMRDPGTGFKTTLTPDPFWKVQLAGEPQLAEIVLYGARTTPDAEGARLVVEVPDAGGPDAWRQVAQTTRWGEPELRLPLGGVRANCVRLRALGSSALAVDEVEVFSTLP